MLAKISTGQMLRLVCKPLFICGHSAALKVPFFSLSASGTFEASLYSFSFLKYFLR